MIAALAGILGTYAAALALERAVGPLAEYPVMSDAAMYEAKKKEKNCVVLARDGTAAP